MLKNISKIFSDLVNIMTLDYSSENGIAVIFHGANINDFPEIKQLIIGNLRSNYSLIVGNRIQAANGEKLNLTTQESIEMVISLMTAEKQTLSRDEWATIA
jgi:hypothetical protein